MYAATFENVFQTIDSDALLAVAGGVDWNRAVDNGNRWGGAGALVGGGVGLAAGGPPGAGVGAAALGAIGWVGGTGYDLYQQSQGR